MLFSDGLPVRLIETPRRDFKTCVACERLPDVVARNTESYDFFPVTEDGGATAQILGLIDLSEFDGKTPPDVAISELMQPLAENLLIGANAPIITFVRKADERSCRLVVSGSQISGLVTLFDLQRLPVRAALFVAVTQLEMAMVKWIKDAFGGGDGWLEKLSRDRRTKVEAMISGAKRDDAYVESLLFTQFADKKTIIVKSHGALSSKNEFKQDMERAEDLRNHLAHANDYAPTREPAKAVCATVRAIEKWIGMLS